MSLVLLDTTYLIDAERGESDLDRTLGDDDDVAIAAITVAELLVGVELASGRRQAARREYVEGILDSIPVIPYDATTAAEHAGILVSVRKSGRPRGAHDLLIAATARATGRIVVTADVTAFADLPGVLVDGHR